MKIFMLIVTLVLTSPVFASATLFSSFTESETPNAVAAPAYKLKSDYSNVDPASLANIYQKGSKLYVWAANGINLRKQPSDSSPIIKKLLYGTDVTVLKQDEPPISYKLRFFTYKNTVQTTNEHPQIILDSQWIKVKTAEQQGYVLNKLLLNIAPMHKNEAFEDYLIRHFKLNKQQRKVKHQKTLCGDAYTKHTTVYQTLTSNKNKIVLNTEESDGDECTIGKGGKIFIPNFSFEKAFIFFNAIMPPVVDVGISYQADQLFEYALDEAAAGEAKLRKTEQGVIFEWYASMN